MNHPPENVTGGAELGVESGGAHTATPWYVEAPNCNDAPDEGRVTCRYAVRAPGVAPVISFQLCELSSINGNEKADAEFIVRACNSHADLVAALKGVLRVADRQTDEFDAARAAIAKATGAA